MFRVPDVEEVVKLSDELGFHFTLPEAEIMQSRMADQLQALDQFHELRLEEEKLPLKYLYRDPGYRPTAEEDPYNVFLRKCHIEGASEGLLQGKRIGLKDNISVAGVPLNFGSHYMDGYIPDFDATVVTRILENGGTIVGKLNMEDFSTSGSGVSGVGDFERVLNPHNTAHVTGGSSSGSGAAVAAGEVDIAFGGDQGGSIRIPSAWCGTVGLKATHGLIPHTGVFGLENSIDYTGPMARRVEDIAITLACVAGPDGYDPRQNNIPQIPEYTASLGRGVEGMRIGVLTEGFPEGTEVDVKEAVLTSTEILEKMGAKAEKVSVPLHKEAMLAWMPIAYEGGKYLYDTNLGGAFAKTVYPTSLITTFGRFKQSIGHEMAYNLKLWITIAAYTQKMYHGKLYAKANNVRKTFVKQYDEAFSKFDLLVMPTCPTKAPVYHTPTSYQEAIDETLFKDNLGLMAGNTAPFDYTGHPAMSLPCAKSKGLPIGMQLVAPYFGEEKMLQAAYAFQESVDWNALMVDKTLSGVAS